MTDRPVILAGLLAFIAVATLPVWYNAAARTRAAAPVLRRPATARACVAPREYMRASHMTLLASWRDDVVRRGDRDWVARDGRHYAKSLSATCFGCHESKKDFCDRCHDYAGVAPSCADCHVEPTGVGKRAGGVK